MEDKKFKEVELRSEEVQEIMGSIPPWILRRGISLLFIVVVLILVGSCFFKYPDVIMTDMTLTGRYPVARIVSRTSGKISELYVADGQEVTVGTPLAIIENPAFTENVFFLKELLYTQRQYPDSVLPAIENKINGGNDFSLGDIQTAYTSYLNCLHEYKNYYSLNYYDKKIAATRSQIDKYRNYYKSQQRQQQVLEEQFSLAAGQYSRDSVLYTRGVISSSEYEEALTVFLSSRYSLENGYASLENLSIQIEEMGINLLDMELQQTEKESVLLQSYHLNTEQLLNAINSWELTYCLSSPIDGKVTFTTYWHKNQFLPSGETVFTVVPDEKNELIGKALLPMERSGKVKTGQRVIIRFTNFPDQEFGMVHGIVSSISLVPAEDNYQVDIALPDGLTTNYGKTLPVTFEMKASAEIVTEDISLLERFFMPLKKVMNEAF